LITVHEIWFNRLYRACRAKFGRGAVGKLKVGLIMGRKAESGKAETGANHGWRKDFNRNERIEHKEKQGILNREITEIREKRRGF